MQSRNEEQKFAEGQGKTKKSRFKIERLEERIAPARGGNPGGPDGHGRCYHTDYRHGPFCGR